MESMSSTEGSAPSRLETLEWDVVSHLPGYRELSIEEGFDWQKLIGEVTEYLGYERSSYYLVVFRSTRKPGDENADLIESLDTAAFNEAIERKPHALLHYFAGTVDEEARALSWCLWIDQGSAREALNGPAHRQAARTAHELYESYDVEGHYLSIAEDGTIVFQPAWRRAGTVQEPAPKN